MVEYQEEEMKRHEKEETPDSEDCYNQAKLNRDKILNNKNFITAQYLEEMIKRGGK